MIENEGTVSSINELKPPFFALNLGVWFEPASPGNLCWPLASGLILAESYYMMGPQPVEDENFCLRWNDYEKKYAETFRTLREDEHFAGTERAKEKWYSHLILLDVTLACEGHAVKAHRIILCACSGYFGHILRTINPAQHPVLLLSDVRPNDLTALMDFIYFGQVAIDALQVDAPNEIPYLGEHHTGLLAIFLEGGRQIENQRSVWKSLDTTWATTASDSGHHSSYQGGKEAYLATPRIWDSTWPYWTIHARESAGGVNAPADPANSQTFR